MSTDPGASCSECGSLYHASRSPMAALCPECSHQLYGYPNCAHVFAAGRCSLCHWDGSETGYIGQLKEGGAGNSN